MRWSDELRRLYDLCYCGFAGMGSHRGLTKMAVTARGRVMGYKSKIQRELDKYDMQWCDAVCPDVAKYGDEADKRIAELEADLRFRSNLSRDQVVSVLLENEKMEQQIEALTQDRNLIAEYLATDPPFDECAGIDIHERAATYSAERYSEQPNPSDYYRAFMDCVRAALQEDE